MRIQQVLFVEDDLIVNQATSDYLRERGLRVLEADDASAAMALLAPRPYLSALVTDVDLGPGESGFDLARRVRAAYPDLPVIYVSATAGPRHVSEGVANSVFIEKPCHPRQIADALRGFSRYPAAA